MPEQLSIFLPAFFAGLAVNFEVAICAAVGALLLGLPLALLRLSHGLARGLADGVVAFCRAAPTFVVMFFLINVVSFRLTVAGFSLGMTPWLAVVLSLIVYGIAYVSDNALEPIRQLRRGSPVLALLFLMSLLRMFFVMVLSSGFGAAVGVVEATTVTLRTIEAMPRVGDRLQLIALVMLMFTISLQTIYFFINWLRGKLSERFASVAVPVAGKN